MNIFKLVGIYAFKFYSVSNVIKEKTTDRWIVESATMDCDRLSLLSRNWNHEGQDLCRSPPQQLPLNQIESQLNRCSPLIGDSTSSYNPQHIRNLLRETTPISPEVNIFNVKKNIRGGKHSISINER